MEVFSPEVARKHEVLKSILADMGEAVVGFSGGVDSGLLLRVAGEMLGSKCVAVIGDSEAFPDGEIAAAQRLAAKLGVTTVTLTTHEMDNPHFRVNNSDRCYHCKNELFSKLREVADERGIRWVADGSHAEDVGDHRPGMRAGEERGVRSPLREAGFVKQEIRELARHLGLSIWDKPSFACLSSRFPYGTEISHELLAKVDRAEAHLRSLGFRQVRVRHHDHTLKIEVETKDLPRAIELALEIVPAIKQLGYTYVTLDLEGYRSGKMNDVLRLSNAPPRRTI